ncbi:MAG: protein TolR [Acetobacteraceae bacterium]|nr:protein TolR [Acetobacteraceae bacterium]
MAISAPRRGGGSGRYAPMAEINVTPMVDVMLVLLIIFMVTAPLLTAGVEINLPRTQASQVNQPDEPLTVSVKADGTIFVQEQPTSVEELAARLAAIAQNKPELRIFVRGDRGANYGRMAEVLGAINRGGFSKVALITDQADPRASQPPAPAPVPPPRQPPQPQRRG